MTVPTLTEPEPRSLDEHDVTLMILPLPMTVDLLCDLTRACSEIAGQHDLDEPVLLFDGTGRVVARRRGAPARA